MKKCLILTIIVFFIISMLFTGIGCKEDAVQTEETEETVEKEEDTTAVEGKEENEEIIKLTYWGWGPHVVAMNEFIGPMFQELHPNVEVEAIAMGPWDLMDKFYAAMVTGKGLPDCAQLIRRHSDNYLIPELLYDFTDYLNENEGMFMDAMNEDVKSVDGRYLAVVACCGPSTLFYDKGLADSLGIDATKIVTWEDFYNVGLELKKDHPDIYTLPIYYPGGGWGANYWRLWMQSAGANIYDDEGKVIVDNTLLRETNDFWNKLNTDLNVYHCTTMDPALWDAVRERKILFLPRNSYYSMELEGQVPELDGEIYSLAWPLWSEDAPGFTGNWGGEALVVPKAGPNAEMAAEFIKFFSSNVDALVEYWFAVGGVPTYGPAREKIMEITDRKHFARDLMESVDVREVPVWNFEDWAETEKIVGDALDNMVVGQFTSEEAMDFMEDQLIKILGR